MSARSLLLPRFKGRRPEELPEALDRLVEELAAELALIRALPRNTWTISSQTLQSSTSVFSLAWQTAHVVDMTAGNVSVRLPYGRKENEGQSVGVIRITASNTLTVYPAGGQYVNGASSLSLGSAGFRWFVWTGDDENGTTNKGWRLVG